MINGPDEDDEHNDYQHYRNDATGDDKDGDAGEDDMIMTTTTIVMMIMDFSMMTM